MNSKCLIIQCHKYSHPKYIFGCVYSCIYSFDFFFFILHIYFIATHCICALRCIYQYVRDVPSFIKCALIHTCKQNHSQNNKNIVFVISVVCSFYFEISIRNGFVFWSLISLMTYMYFGFSRIELKWKW